MNTESVSTNGEFSSFSMFASKLTLIICQRPVSLRSRDQSRCYSSLLMQSMFFIPQLRSRITRWDVDEYAEAPTDLPGWDSKIYIELEDINTNPDFVPYTLFHLFAYMDLAVLSYITVGELPICTGLSVAATATDFPGDLTSG